MIPGSRFYPDTRKAILKIVLFFYLSLFAFSFSAPLGLYGENLRRNILELRQTHQSSFWIVRQIQ